MKKRLNILYGQCGQCGDCFNFYSVIALHNDVLIESNNGCVINGIINFLYVKPGVFPLSVNAGYEATTILCCIPTNSSALFVLYQTKIYYI